MLDLGYTHDHTGEPLERDDQVLEMFPQDFIVAANAKGNSSSARRRSSMTCWSDSTNAGLLQRPHAEDLVGHPFVPCAAHLWWGVVAHHRLGGLFWRLRSPLFHAAKRRNWTATRMPSCPHGRFAQLQPRCILPANRGARWTLLVLTTRLNPTEVDGSPERGLCMVLEAAFYEATQQAPPKTVIEMMESLNADLVRWRPFADTASRTIARPWTVGLRLSLQDLETMIDKMNGQLGLGHRLRGVDIRLVASSVIRRTSCRTWWQPSTPTHAKSEVREVRPFLPSYATGGEMHPADQGRRPRTRCTRRVPLRG
ncbi:MAG: hypothetical protein CM15mP18_4590 [Methanobacteriota archaeon]|nr:MAG: hypothetical protein CM15mP18_4590 [Euryarchaeota archaeon]